MEKNLIDPATVSNGRFRPDDALTFAEFASFVIRGMKIECSERNLSIEQCMTEAVQKGIISAEKNSTDIICRADCYSGLVRVME